MIGKNIIHLNEVDSTNNYARGLIGKGMQEGTVVLAHTQLKGKGHAQNLWESNPYENLTFSILLNPVFLNPGQQFSLSQIVSLGIVDFLNPRCESVSIKWPNDIYVGNKKIAGILIENSIIGSQLSNSVIGIGMNINQQKFSSWIPNPTSLKIITGKDFSLEECLTEVCENIATWYEILENGDLEKIKLRYLSRLYLKETWAKFNSGEKLFKGRIKGIDEIGRLLIENEKGRILSFQFKEVEYVL